MGVIVLSFINKGRGLITRYSVLSLDSHESSIIHEPHFGLRATQV